MLFRSICFLLLGSIIFAAGQGVKDESETEMAASVMNGFDTNKDGKISFLELKEHVGDNAGFQGWQAGFQEADADKDGHLTTAELTVLLTHSTKQKKDELIDESEHSIAASVMAGFDTDKDGKLTLKELQEHVGDNKEVHAAFQGWQAGFQEADVDKDGSLTIDELATLLSHVSGQDQQELVHESEESIAASIMDGFDSDKDGKLSLKELKEHVGDNKELHAAFEGWEAGFKEADVDNDEHLTVHELASLLSHVSRQDQQDLVQDSEESIAASIMDGFDTDKDGKLSIKELKEHVGDNKELHAAFQGWEAGFYEADADKDKHLTVHELASLLSHVSRQDQHELVHDSEEAIAGSILDGFDTNKDGKISLKELMERMGDKTHVHAAFAGWTAGFKQADVDKDGHLNADELTSMLMQVSREDQHEMVEQSEEQVAASIMDGFDTDKDGKLSLKELKEHVGDKVEGQAAFAGWEDGFKEADADKDEHLTVHELANLLAHVSRQGQHEMVDQSEKSIGESIMEGFDADKDGKLTLKELMDHVGDHEHIHAAFEGWQDGFKEADVDKDGHLTADELTSLISHVSRQDQEKMVEESHAQMYSMVLDGFDADKNGKLSLEELEKQMGGQAGMHKMFEGWQDGFKEADANSDEHIDSDEMKSFFGHISKQYQKHLVAESEKRVVKKMMRSFDGDKDKHVSMKELMERVGSKSDVTAFVDGWRSGFREADADYDGLLDAEEMGSLVNHIKRQHRHKLVEEAEATAASVMDGFDSDKDGKISLKELEDKVGAAGPAADGFKGWKHGFKEADADKDGHLTAEELAAWFKVVGATPKHDEM